MIRKQINDCIQRRYFSIRILIKHYNSYVISDVDESKIFLKKLVYFNYL